MENRPGTYILLLQCKKATNISIGKLGTYTLAPGYYAYVGSAFGPGGIRARVDRHLRKEKNLRWHIDYVRAHMCVIAIWYSYEDKKLECDWAAILARMGGVTPIRACGASDCRCYAHLFYFTSLPDPTRFEQYSQLKLQRRQPYI